MKATMRVLFHFAAVSMILLVAGFVLLVSQNGSISYWQDDRVHKVDGEGPHLFYEDTHVSALTIKGNREDGFYIHETKTRIDLPVDIEVYFPLDDSRFSFAATTLVETPPAQYQTEQPIFAISDLEGNFKAFRDMLIAHQIIDEKLNWTFNSGHLVLLGDMVDRGQSTTQLLWLIFKLEQEAKLAGGQVHYILGNHEIKNLQGNFKSAADKYIPIAGMLGKTQADLFSDQSVIGRWLATKNALELINGHLFMHGGLHSDIVSLNLSIEQINEVIRNQYRQFYFPKKGQAKSEQLLRSNQTGPAWYRGLFKGQVSQQSFDSSLSYFGAKTMVVGHTIQSSINTTFDGKLIAIDVKHPSDYEKNLPSKSSEALLIEGNNFYRLLENSKRIEL
jgi:hypothetical protein